MAQEKMEVVWPLGKLTQHRQRLAPRLDTLEGKTICGLYNGHFQFEKTWELLQQLLSKKYSGIKFVGWQEFGLFHDTTEKSLIEALPARLKQHGCDAVISGTGC